MFGVSARSQHATALDEAVADQLCFTDWLATEHSEHRIGADAGFGLEVEADGSQRRGQHLVGVVAAKAGHRDVLRDAQPQLLRGLLDAVGDAVGGAQ